MKQKNLAEGVKHSKERRIVREMNEQCKESTKEEGVAGGGGDSHQSEPEEQIKRQQKRHWLGIKATDSKNFQFQVQRKDGTMMGSPLGEVGKYWIFRRGPPAPVSAAD